MWIMYRISWYDIKQKSNNKSHQLKDNKCFQYAAAVALNQEKNGGHPERVKTNQM